MDGGTRLGGLMADFTLGVTSPSSLNRMLKIVGDARGVGHMLLQEGGRGNNFLSTLMQKCWGKKNKGAS